MGIGPVPATQEALRPARPEPADFDVIELNEAFASQGIAVLRELGIAEDAEHVNPNGGAIALGHPLGMSGARIAGTAALELQVTGKKRALATMCIGVGQGIAMALEARLRIHMTDESGQPFCRPSSATRRWRRLFQRSRTCRRCCASSGPAEAEAEAG